MSFETIRKVILEPNREAIEEVIRCNQRSLEAIRCHSSPRERPSKRSSAVPAEPRLRLGNQWPSVAISGHQPYLLSRAFDLV